MTCFPILYKYIERIRILRRLLGRAGARQAHGEAPCALAGAHAVMMDTGLERLQGIQFWGL